jgi:hypothetical protein
MVKLVTKPAVMAPGWMVELGVEFLTPGPPPAVGDLEPLVELMQRTEGVRFVAVLPLESAGLSVAVVMSAPDASAALEYTRGLVASCARYAGLGEIAIRQVRVVTEPAPDEA